MSWLYAKFNVPFGVTIFERLMFIMVKHMNKLENHQVQIALSIVIKAHMVYS